MIPIFYRPEQSSNAAKSYSPSAGKPALAVKDWLSIPEIAPHIEIKSFDPVSEDILCAAHNETYVRGILTGNIRNGFGNTSDDIANSLRYTVGSIVAAATHVLTAARQPGLRVAVSPTSGFHHAGYNFSGGFCTFNGLMAAAIRVYSLGLAKRILIIDLDQHYGDGTDDIINKLGLDYVDHITATKSYDTAGEALQCANLSANTHMREKRYDLVLYQAGADIHIDDPLGGRLTTEQMIKRDQLIFQACAEFDVPIVWNLAGGYKLDSNGTIEPVLALHRNTMLECIRANLMKENMQTNQKTDEAPEQSEIIIDIVAEGGGLTLFGVRTKQGWAYSRNVLDQTTLLLDGTSTEHDSTVVTSWKDALALLDVYPWQHLFPLIVHPEFRPLVLDAVKARYKIDKEKNPRRLPDWERVCSEIGGDICFRSRSDDVESSSASYFDDDD
jgi:acetoin utilization deacetylase AcuC-like enzyme